MIQPRNDVLVVLKIPCPEGGEQEIFGEQQSWLNHMAMREWCGGRWRA